MNAKASPQKPKVKASGSTPNRSMIDHERLNQAKALERVGLSMAQRERLTVLIEEAGEVITAATKILRFGYDSYNEASYSPTTNIFALQNEIGHFENAVNLMVHFNDIDSMFIKLARDRKSEQIHKYLLFQPTSKE